MLKSHSDIQLITQSHLLELTQIFQELLITLILLKECTIINGNLELLIQRLSGIILQKILSITLNLNLIKISKILILIWKKLNKDLIIIGNLQLKQNPIQFVDLEDAFPIMLKSLLVIQLTTQSHHLELTQIFLELLKILISPKECTIINGNLELLIQRLNGIIPPKILCIISNLNLTKISKTLIQI